MINVYAGTKTPLDLRYLHTPESFFGGKIAKNGRQIDERRYKSDRDQQRVKYLLPDYRKDVARVQWNILAVEQLFWINFGLDAVPSQNDIGRIVGAGIISL
jgi:hypothetical protein